MAIHRERREVSCPTLLVYEHEIWNFSKVKRYLRDKPLRTECAAIVGVL